MLYAILALYSHGDKREILTSCYIFICVDRSGTMCIHMLVLRRILYNIAAGYMYYETQNTR